MGHKFNLFFHKLTHWEYWPFEIVYFPIYFVWFYFAIRARAVFFGTAANPTIQNGGFLMESKKQIYDLLPEGSYPRTIKIKCGTPRANVLAEIQKSKLTFPLIGKPDIGLRGMAIQKLDTSSEIENYIQKMEVDFLLQEYIDYPLEAGIFYVRFPGQQSGKITGMVWKEFVIVEGDGLSSVKNLLERNPRFHFQLPAIEKIYGEELNNIPKAGELLNLVPYGNHARGSKFTDATSRVTPALSKTIDELCTKIPHFYFGRLDVRFRSLEDLAAGKYFSIIELNGAGSDPTHIYDPKHSLFFAWKEITKHLNFLFKISKMNMHEGYPSLTFKEGMQMLSANSAHLKKLKSFATK